MAITFNVHETPQPHSRENEPLSHGRVVARDTKRMDDICNMICQRASISSADVKAVLDSLVWYIGHSLNNGDHVELEDLGHFSPSLRSVKTGEDEITVQPNGVNFRCSEKLKKQIREAQLKRMKRPAEPDMNKRKALLMNHFKHYASITTPVYAALSQCSYYRATADLRHFINDGLIERIGKGSHISFVLTENRQQ